MTSPEPSGTLPHIPFTEDADATDQPRADEPSAQQATPQQAGAHQAGARRPGAEQPAAPPTWRGWIHLATFPVAVALGIILITLAASPAAKASSAVFMATSLVLFGVSATYHRFAWGSTVKRVLKRIDHTNIFLLIAGTYTPIAVCALATTPATVLLVLMWSGALLGIAFRVFWIGAPRWLYVPLYVLLGCAALAFLPQLFAANVAMMTLELAGGLAYVVGAVVYGFKRPNPAPAVFGFHEVFHALTVVAFLAQWVGILVIAIQPVR